MDIIFPFDPIQRSKDIESLVMQGDARRYYRFRYAKFYGGIVTADAVGCNLLCAYCWNYFRNENPGIKDLGYFEPREVSKKLQDMGKSHNCDKFRISGCEPFLGEASTQHLTDIIKSIPSGNFIIETNALMLGYDPSLIGHLVGLDNIQIRIAVKGDNPSTWEKVTGAKGVYQPCQIKAVQELRANHVETTVAYMPKFVNPNLLGLGYDEDFDSESLRYYKSTKVRLIKRGLFERPIKPSKPVYRPVKPKEGVISQGTLEYWDDKGDIT